MNCNIRSDVMGYSERELLARMIQCEAGGEGDNRNESSSKCHHE